MLKKIENCSLFQKTNWQRTELVYDFICNQLDLGLYTNSYYESAYGSKIISLGEGQGGVIESFHMTEKTPWRIWTGPLLEKTIPWSEKLKHRLLSHNLNFVNFSYARHFKSISAHIDGKTDKEGNQGHCNLNYIIDSSDADAYTWAKDKNNNKVTIKSENMITLLLNTATEHGVENSRPRSTFTVKFHEPYNIVDNFLTNNKDIFDYEMYH
jgi:hypothetical protein